ncbi:thiosulfate oxidation carrier protein SoxY [Meiothermus sp. QL-1]|uniref:thiosulfate oxidation carrier protein SoxY n=1 Tax=Meiothermus sp. QL-1 TaxID=2058095 RepID=UPI000E0BD711|nr:thiosulfate oxidation carrier protein SoxY [Meiothermus sp. QL-1]RDI94582.1 thiosulfate oxidation carrier protein SoxY [Meiothermus sp. QL-1]
MNRRRFLKASAATVAASVLAAQVGALAQGALEGEDLANLEKGLQAHLGKGYKDLVPSNAIKLTAPQIAESGANVPVEIEVNLPAEQVKAIHCFCDKNANPLLFSFQLLGGGVQPYYATRVRVAETAPVRAVVETKDGRLLVASQGVRVTVGGCG